MFALRHHQLATCLFASFGLFWARQQTDTITPELINAFTLYHHKFTGGQYVNEDFSYQLFVPKSADLKPAPLIIWLHGSGDIELNRRDTGQLLHLLLILDEPSNSDKYPFFILAMQMKKRSWFESQFLPGSGSEDPYDQLTVQKDIIDEVLSRHAIDRQRVYLAGVSTGGTACFELAMRFPNYFAAVAPMASGNIAFANTRRLANIPIWAFHSSADKLARPAPIRQLINQINSEGGQAKFTETGNTGAEASHDCWVAAFQDYHLLGWLLMQQKGVPATSRTEWSIRRIGVGLFALTVLSVAAARYVAYRSRVRKATNK